MKPSAYSISGKSIIFASILILAAAVLFAVALSEPKRTETGEWIPLNDALETALVSQNKLHSGEGDTQKEFHKPSIPEKNPELLQAPASSLAESDLPDKDKDAVATTETPASTMPLTTTETIDNTSVDAGKLDINRATEAELDDLKGIGPAKAKAIIEDRLKNGKYISVDDLLRVKGIGEKLLQGIQDSIVARP